MKNLDKAISSLKLEELKAEKPATKSNLIEPTEAEIKLIVAALKDGKAYKDIKKEIRRDVKGSKLGFSYGQIKEIDLKRQAKITELSPKEDELNV